MLFRRSLIQELSVTAAGVFLFLAGIVIAQRAGYLIQLSSKGSLPNDAITTILGFNMIRFLPIILALSLFLAILLTLSRWYRDSEMVVWFSAGLSVNSFIRPVLVFAIPVIVLIAFLSLFVTPWAINKVEDYRVQLESRDDLSTLNPGVFKESALADRVFFVESFDELGNIVKNIFVQSVQHEKLSIITASKGSRETKPNGDNFLVMKQGHRYQGTPGTAEYSTTAFEKYEIRVEAIEAKREAPTTQSVSSSALLKNLSSTNVAELQWRLSMPISALILAMLAIALSALDPRAGRSANFIFALVIYILYINLLSIIQAWIAQGKINPLIGLWPVHLLFAALASYMLYQRTRQRSILPNLLSNLWQKKSNLT
ncbi:MAG: LPS export ABC transporter permease LptF [Methylophilaceae bacterium]